MTYRREPDEVDLWCGGWAATRRSIWGIVLASKLEPKDTVGRMSCTLGRIKEDREGAATAGLVSQKWPEVYQGMSLIIHRAFVTMPDQNRKMVMDAHYVWKELHPKVKAEVMGISVATYWERLGLLKGYLEGYVRSNRDSEDGGYRTTKSATAVRYF